MSPSRRSVSIPTYSSFSYFSLRPLLLLSLGLVLGVPLVTSSSLLRHPPTPSPSPSPGNVTMLASQNVTIVTLKPSKHLIIKEVALNDSTKDQSHTLTFLMQNTTLPQAIPVNQNSTTARTRDTIQQGSRNQSHTPTPPNRAKTIIVPSEISTQKNDNESDNKVSSNMTVTVTSNNSTGEHSNQSISNVESIIEANGTELEATGTELLTKVNTTEHNSTVREPKSPGVDEFNIFNNFHYWLQNFTSCSTNVTLESEGPEQDNVQLKEDMKNLIVEYVVGGKNSEADPDQLRIRTYVVWKFRYTKQLLVLNDEQLGAWEQRDEETEMQSDSGNHQEDTSGSNDSEDTAKIKDNVQKTVSLDTGSSMVKRNTNESGNDDKKIDAPGDNDMIICDASEDSDCTSSSNDSVPSQALNNTKTVEERRGKEENKTAEASGNEEEEKATSGEGMEIKEIIKERKELNTNEMNSTGDGTKREKQKVKYITEMTVEEGTRLRLVCNVTGVKDYWVEWRREANLTFPDGSVVVGGRSVLLQLIGREDAGTYICTARSIHGAQHSTALTIHVNYAPVVGVWAWGVEGEGVEMGCMVEARPQATLAWYKNNTRITDDSCTGNVEIRSSVMSPGFEVLVLHLTNITDEDYAFYHCRANNSLGVSRAFIMFHDGSGKMSLNHLYREVKYTTPVENPRLASFMLGMIPPLYIALYIIAYLGCYKTPGTGGRFGNALDAEGE
ncbi:hypothetical protein Pcinc_020926 [Petrolisthes cinctipes]|uniref:Ig-like domain-containing protein n=1 Tax=Petrolisthes cinctipes TaxID=88211 RepID=A0AAE1KKM5_PETCI|nr:hypothetical protein Pcinc_020926 [Petrolisthes cinctipes]